MRTGEHRQIDISFLGSYTMGAAVAWFDGISTGEGVILDGLWQDKISMPIIKTLYTPKAGELRLHFRPLLCNQHLEKDSRTTSAKYYDALWLNNQDKLNGDHSKPDRATFCRQHGRIDKFKLLSISTC